MSEKKKKTKGLDAGKNLDKIRKNLEDSADVLRGSIPTIENVKQNRKEIAEKLKRIEENVESVKKLLAALRRRADEKRGINKRTAPKKRVDDQRYNGPRPTCYAQHSWGEGCSCIYSDECKKKSKKKKVVQFLSEAEYKKLYPKKKKAVVYFQKSDFSSLDEYIEYMRRPPISDEEAGCADWDDFLKKLSNWKPSK